ncbi:hypothetical protein G647_04315 [Cladophialophora carrionii CBS 160.54]|uniref:DUF6594 domain-containing protein n=1 Tax=Cladophialophora carrionii CBS 160.54 TaxID=1279043 RepID=V9DDM9_9EURO|nr:uncharacterized protein G647_04315 [Cladophialophora carrionii CBS 160.54]ETI24945.1 hypothetical protein G647_04315 [Cladophialophora carrionii CBS 160.54]
MFVSVRDRPQGRRRRSQTYGVNKAARSSKLSLLSAITTGSHQSHGSNDSSSTITQESYSKSSSSATKRSKSSRTKSSRDARDRKPSSRKGSSGQTIEEKSMSRESVDVFEFLVKEDEQDALGPDLKEPPHAELQTVETTPSVRDDSDTESVVRSTHSDSGISMGDSIIHFGNDSPVETRLPPLPEDGREQPEPVEPQRDQPNHSKRIQWKWPEVPRATHKHHLPSYAARTHSPEHARFRIPQSPDIFEGGFCSPAHPLSGYDLVSDKLASGELPPVFRSFKKIRYRLLLQLQDEILEMEQQLAALDVADTQTRLNPDGSTSPASRRLSWQWSQSDLPAHRLHILGRLSIKLEQYYQVLSTSQKVHRLTSSPLSAEVGHFRAWLKEHNPLAHLESRFLDDDEDLISLTEPSDSSGSPAAEPTSDFLPLCVLTMTLLPLLSFKFMTSVLNRLIVLTIVLAAGLGSLEKLDRARAEQHKQWIFACFGVSLLAAILF